MIGPQWIRVEQGLPCPICKKTDWCLLHIDGKKVICPRIKSGTFIQGSGYIHKVYDNGLSGTKRTIRRRSNRAINWTNINRLYVQQGVNHLRDLSRKLSLRVETFQKFLVGWDKEAYTIPAYNGFQEMNGIMRRFPDGGKTWVPRSRNGLFIPRMKSIEGNLFVNEGWTDTATLVELGFRAIGRANCDTGLEYIKDFITTHPRIAMVTIVGDRDKVGQAGANKLVRGLYGSKIQLSVLDVPIKYKDMRQWYTEGDVDYQGVIMKVRRL